MGTAIPQKGSQVRDDVLQRLALVLLALELDVRLDIHGRESRQAAVGPRLFNAMD
jgi:hypothetical protein